MCAEPRLHTFSVTTSVEFEELSAEAIQAYIASGEPFGKAGSYGAHARGRLPLPHVLPGGGHSALCVVTASLRIFVVRAPGHRSSLLKEAPACLLACTCRHTGPGGQLCAGHRGLLFQRRRLPAAPLWHGAGDAHSQRRAALVTMWRAHVCMRLRACSGRRGAWVGRRRAAAPL